MSHSPAKLSLSICSALSFHLLLFSPKALVISVVFSSLLFSLTYLFLFFVCLISVQILKTENNKCHGGACVSSKILLLLLLSSRSQMRDSSQFAGAVTACSLCACRVAATSQTPSCMPWDRTAPASGEFTHLHTALHSGN